MPDLKQILSKHVSSIVFENDEVEKLNGISQLSQYEAGAILFEAGDPGDALFLIGSGAVDLFTIVDGNLEQTLLSVQEGGFVGVMVLVEEGVRDINARVSEKADIYRFEKDRLAQIIAEGGLLSLKLLKLVAEIASARSRILLVSLRQNLEWTMQVSGLAALDISQLIVDQASIKIELMHGKHLTGTIMKAEERPHGYELYVKTGDGTIHFIPYHAIASASFPLGEFGRESKIKGV